MSGMAIFGLAALSALPAVNIAIAVAAVILGRRQPFHKILGYLCRDGSTGSSRSSSDLGMCVHHITVRE